MKRRKLFLIGSGVIIVAGYLFYAFLTSPGYSLRQIKNALEEHDMPSFEKYVNTKAVVGGMVDRHLQEIVREQVNSVVKNLEDSVRGAVYATKEKLENHWMQLLKELVASGKIDGKKELLGELLKKNDTISFKGIDEVKKDGKVATVSVDFNEPRFDTTLVLNLRMRDKGGYWQLFDASTVFDFAQTVEQLEERRVDRLNEKIDSIFRKSLKVSVARLGTETKGTSSYTYYSHTYFIEFENVGAKEISKLTCVFNIVAANGSKLESGYFGTELKLQPGQKYEYKVEDAFSEENVDPKGISVKLQGAGVKFSDGSNIKWHFKWEDLE